MQEAVETWDKYWQALFVKIRARIARRQFKEIERHYAYFLLKDYRQFAKLLRGEIPDFELELSSRKQIASYVRRLVKKLKGKAPLVKKRRHVKFDANCYDVFEHQGRQYLTLMSLERGKRIILPLEGKSSITGNIAFVLNEENIEIHIFYDLKTKLKTNGISEAIDLGYTEVITDTEDQALKIGKENIEKPINKVDFEIR